MRETEMTGRHIEENRVTAANLLTVVDRVVALADREAEAAGTAASSAVNVGMIVLVALNVLNVIVVVALGRIFAGRYLIHRLTGLAASMRSMAEGDLEVPVEVGGNDEVTDMAKALDVFRHRALEVERLNLVETLADEIRDKNAELEQTLQDLKTAQHQVIMQEKLSALGQLTAGIAHEIKNPVNFVNNFSEVSGELIEEVRGVLGEVREKVPDGPRGAIEGLLDDLTANLGKIAQHGKRADGIVRSMLEHSRGKSGEFRAVDLNALLKQYADLAYHAMRAKDRNFNVAWEEDLDMGMGDVEWCLRTRAASSSTSSPMPVRRRLSVPRPMAVTSRASGCRARASTTRWSSVSGTTAPAFRGTWSRRSSSPSSQRSPRERAPVWACPCPWTL